MYTRCLLVFTKDYEEIHFVFPDYEKSDVGKHKLKTVALAVNKKQICHTDIEVISNIAIPEGTRKSWRDIVMLWKESFNVRKITEEFFEDYKIKFFDIKKHLKKQGLDPKKIHEYTLNFLNRIMFIYFISKKGWLGKDTKFMKSYWKMYKDIGEKNAFYSHWMQPLFFEAFNNKYRSRLEWPEQVNSILTNCPYLNGGLFKRKHGLDDLKVSLPDCLIEEVLNFFEKYNFTIKEDSELDIEVSVDPQMIGYVYESLANVTEDFYEKEEDSRKEWGIFYTARAEVYFMCRISLVEYLSKRTEIPKDLLLKLVFEEEKKEIEQKFSQKSWNELEDTLDDLSIVDPACGSGAFLVGMLNILADLYKVIHDHTSTNLDDFESKLRIIQRSLYGIDVMPWAVHASELRLWLQLVVETSFKNSELKEKPLLPNLDMNLRVGDSLVQELGGISFNVRNNTLNNFLDKKIKQLQEEKRRYFNSPRDSKYKTPEEFKNQEIKLFLEILRDRIVALKEKNTTLLTSEKKKGKTISLSGKEANSNAKNIQKEINQRRFATIQIENNEKEIEKLKKIGQELKDPGKKPFVWDIDFAEIFSVKEGFDIVIGNPPYVRQENIAPPNILKKEITNKNKQEYKERLIKSVKTRFPFIKSIDKKSDLYIYFYFHGLSLLNQEGVFCFITASSWLDVNYGKELQEFLLRHCHMIAIYENESKRSFAHADVNTVIALLGPPKLEENKQPLFYDSTYNGKNSGLNKTAKFIMFKKPFEEATNSKNMEVLEKSKELTSNEDFRIYPVRQEKLLEDGWNCPENQESNNKSRFLSGKYLGDKLGGKYLRAPDIYYKIMEKGKGSLVKLKNVVQTSFGLKTGVNEFFFLKEDDVNKWKIEKQFLRGIIKSPRDSKKLK